MCGDRDDDVWAYRVAAVTGIGWWATGASTRGHSGWERAKEFLGRL